MRKRKINWIHLILVIVIGLGLIVGLIGAGYGIYKVCSSINNKNEKDSRNALKTAENVCLKYEVASLEKPLIKEEKDVITPPELISIGEFKLTAYCQCELCCGEWSGGPTYTGTMPVANRTVAVDPNVIPLGTKLMIEGFDNIVFIAEDTGSGINENKIDIYVNEHEECFKNIYNRIAEVFTVEELENE